MADDAKNELLGLVAGRRERAADKSRVSALFASSSEDEDGELASAVPAPRVARSPVSEDEDDDGFDADLMGDDEDRARLAAMPEVEREAVLYERAQARAAKAERRALAEKMRQLDAAASGHSADGAAPRTQRAPSSETARKRQTLEELKAARLERQKTGRISRTSGASRRAARESDSEYSEASSDEERVSFSKSKTHRETRDGTAAELLDLALAERMRITRDDVCRLAAHPEFEDRAQGCLMRLSIGARPGTGEPVYRLVEVRRIVPYHRSYRVPHSSGDDASGTTTNKAALLRYGRQEKTFRLDVVSNAPFTAAEFERWTATMREEDVPIFARRTAETRADAWRELVERPLSDSVVSAMVAAKRELGVAPRETVAEQRVRLLHERDEAFSDSREADVSRIDAELAALGDAARSASSAQVPVRKRALLAPSSASLGAGKQADMHLDPFSRRKCQPSAHHFADDLDSRANGDAQAPQPPQHPAAQPAPAAAPRQQPAARAHSTADAHLAIDLDMDD